MSRATGIVAKLNGALRKVGPNLRTVYKRATTTTGDSLIGRTTSAYVDTLLNPQPIYERVGRTRITGARGKPETIVTDGKALLADDYEVLLSASSITEDDLQDKDFLLIFINANGDEERLSLLDYETTSLNGQPISFVGYFRSVKR